VNNTSQVANPALEKLSQRKPSEDDLLLESQLCWTKTVPKSSTSEPHPLPEGTDRRDPKTPT